MNINLLEEINQEIWGILILQQDLSPSIKEQLTYLFPSLSTLENNIGPQLCFTQSFGHKLWLYLFKDIHELNNLSKAFQKDESHLLKDKNVLVCSPKLKDEKINLPFQLVFLPN